VFSSQRDHWQQVGERGKRGERKRCFRNGSFLEELNSSEEGKLKQLEVRSLGPVTRLGGGIRYRGASTFITPGLDKE